MGFKEDLAAAKASAETVEPPRSPVIEVAVNEQIYSVVFYRASSVEWSHATRKSPPRSDVDLDRRNGYDLSAVAREISAVSGRVVEDGAEIELSPDEWTDLWAVMAPTSARYIEANVWHLHEHDAAQEIERAKKASKPRPASRRKSS